MPRTFVFDYHDEEHQNNSLVTNWKANKKLYSDVKIILEDGETYAHKFILSAKSDYFAKMFDADHNFIEANGKEVHMPFKLKYMEKVLEYLYGGNLDAKNFTEIEIIPLLDLLRFMLLENAFGCIRDRLHDKIVHDLEGKTDFVRKYLAVAEVARRHQLFDTLEIIANSLAPHLDLIVDICSQEILLMSYEVMEVFMYIIHKPLTKFRLIRKWLDKHGGNNETKKETCSKFINLHEFDSADLVSEVRESGIYDDTELLDVVAPKINQEMDVMVLNDADRTAEFINLRLIGQDDSEYRFRVKKTIHMAKLKESYSSRVGKHISFLRFMFDGSRLSDDSSPQSLDMENNDIIEVFHAM